MVSNQRVSTVLLSLIAAPFGHAFVATRTRWKSNHHLRQHKSSSSSCKWFFTFPSSPSAPSLIVYATTTGSSYDQKRQQLPRSDGGGAMVKMPFLAGFVRHHLRTTQDHSDIESYFLSDKNDNRKRIKKGRMSLEKLALELDEELHKSQWFVTGRVNPQYFCSDFTYEDADVRLDSLQEYAMDVNALFDQSCTRADIICTEVDPDRLNVITCTWRLSGRANLLWGLRIKPCYVYTDFVVNPQNGLIQRQEDHYSLPHWDLFLSAIFPFLNGILTAPEAPPVPPRFVVTSSAQNEVSPLQVLVARASIFNFFASIPSPGLTTVMTMNHNKQHQEQQPVYRGPETSRLSPFSSDALPGLPLILPISLTRHQKHQHDVPVVAGGGDMHTSNGYNMASSSSSSSSELFCYNDYDQHLISTSSRTRQVTSEEAAKMLRDDKSPLHDLLNFVHQGLLAAGKDKDAETVASAVPWYGNVLKEHSGSHARQHLPEIRAILADGTKIPAIRPPTWMDRAKLYIPEDCPETRRDLKEATRRAASRRQLHSSYRFNYNHVSLAEAEKMKATEEFLGHQQQRVTMAIAYPIHYSEQEEETDQRDQDHSMTHSY